MSGDEEASVRAATEGELHLMEPEVRSSPEAAGELLDPDFTEVGSSGRRWNREEMLAELPGLQGGSADGPHYRAADIAGVLLAPGLVHLTYETDFAGRRARRSSLWRRSGTGVWRMYRHQATPVPDGTP